MKLRPDLPPRDIVGDDAPKDLAAIHLSERSASISR
jgi:hypothetical protein